MKALKQALADAVAKFDRDPTDANEQRVFGLRNQIRNQEEFERKHPWARPK